jgi:hypothetical protein
MIAMVITLALMTKGGQWKAKELPAQRARMVSLPFTIIKPPQR